MGAHGGGPSVARRPRECPPPCCQCQWARPRVGTSRPLHSLDCPLERRERQAPFLGPQPPHGISITTISRLLDLDQASHGLSKRKLVPQAGSCERGREWRSQPS